MILQPGQTWVAPTDFGMIEVDSFDQNYGFWFLYLKMVYHSTLVYSMVDISARNINELAWVSLLIIVSAIINAIIYGQFANLTEELKASSKEFVDKLNLINQVMANESLPLQIKNDIREYILTTHNLKRLQDEQVEFNSSISSSKKALVRIKIFSKAYHDSRLARFMKISLYQEWLEIMRINRTLKNAGAALIDVIPINDNYNQIIDSLSRDTEMDFFEPDRMIVRQGYRVTDLMYIISQGQCKVSVYDKSMKTQRMQDIEVRQIKKHDYFGEISLVYDSVRSATVTCTNYCTLGKIKLETLHALCANHHFVKIALIKSIQTYND